MSLWFATGETVVRKQLWEKLAAQGIPLETLVSPEVYLDEFDTLHPGCVLTEGTILGGNNTFGLCSYVNLGCKIGAQRFAGCFFRAFSRVYCLWERDNRRWNLYWHWRCNSG